VRPQASSRFPASGNRVGARESLGRLSLPGRELAVFPRSRPVNHRHEAVDVLDRFVGDITLGILMAVDDAVPELSEMEERVVVADWRGGKGPADRILALGLIHGAGRQANEGGFT